MIPVRDVAEIAVEHGMSLAVLIAYQPEERRMHCATWGARPEEKCFAADIGEKCMAAIGADLSKQETFSDFREDYSAAKHRALEDACLLLLEDRNFFGRPFSPAEQAAINRIRELIADEQTDHRSNGQ